MQQTVQKQINEKRGTKHTTPLFKHWKELSTSDVLQTVTDKVSTKVKYIFTLSTLHLPGISIVQFY